jgi:sugar phosphate isomerase/epimerase
MEERFAPGVTMSTNLDRREFIGAAACCLPLLGGRRRRRFRSSSGRRDSTATFKISLAEWSLHRTIFGGELDNLDFPAFAKREFGIDCVEYVNQFFLDNAQDQAYLAELKNRCDDNEVRSGLIMCDREGDLGDPDDAARAKAVENHYKWVEAAKFLGCHSIRVNARSAGSYNQQMELAADGLRRLCEFAAPFAMNVLVENHGGLSSNGTWLASVIRKVDLPNCGTLPDFGNFQTSPGEWYDRYQGVRELMPYAKGVSAKSHEFGADGREVRTDYFQMMEIVLGVGYHGHVGIEWEGDSPGEVEGIRLTQRLLEQVRTGVA